ncbi:MAG: RluA family pseudouridine synthase [Acidobacteriota bacterium]
MPHKKFRVKDESDEGKRLDLYLSESISELSRRKIQDLIREGKVLVNFETAQKSSCHIRCGDQIEIKYEISRPFKIIPEDIPLDIVYQDECLAVINKASGMVVHPGAKIQKHTLVNSLVYHFPEIKKAGPKVRPGIVHRLDKETSGLLVIAKNPEAFDNLGAQFRKRIVQKKYMALVWGRYCREEGVVSWPIGRHVKNGARMSIKTKKAKEAETHFKVLKGFNEHSLLDVKPITGRTHQIRVHMSASGHPIVGDQRYGKRKKRTTLKSRLFLHAYYLSFIHPENQKRLEFSIPLPEELQRTLEKI